MSKRATATFEVASWDEQPFSEVDGGPRLTRATVTKSFPEAALPPPAGTRSKVRSSPTACPGRNRGPGLALGGDTSLVLTVGARLT